MPVALFASQTQELGRSLAFHPDQTQPSQSIFYLQLPDLLKLPEKLVFIPLFLGPPPTPRYHFLSQLRFEDMEISDLVLTLNRIRSAVREKWRRVHTHSKQILKKSQGQPPPTYPSEASVN